MDVIKVRNFSKSFGPKKVLEGGESRSKKRGMPGIDWWFWNR